ncbi:hypothetical protein D3OALGA1CA_2871 [Olavius algarvensis associated proteobacterium Delta 3]|nr:hypothetical protein D3OALGA1CA_2871 [Olavius algarvensis associated proteobacterium Delta 3]CAB5163026.1 hypothetical protein D3OALGB2SA_5553 [Olavius algarvensis associated proteobacterium Delta 3]
MVVTETQWGKSLYRAPVETVRKIHIQPKFGENRYEKMTLD